MDTWHLKNKKALITGGSRGIGRAVAVEFLSLGAEVLITARTGSEVDAAVKELGGISPGIHGLEADVSKAEDRNKIVSWIDRNWGHLDILVNNAGINIRKPSIAYSPEEVLQVLDIDLVAPFELCRALFAFLKEGRSPSVINVSSVAGSYDVNTGAPYGMAKAGLIQLSRNLAVEWAPQGIRVNTVSPWFTATPLARRIIEDPQKLEAITSRTPLGRIAQSDEIASVIAFFAMDKASYVTGQNVDVDGGVTSRLL